MKKTYLLTMLYEHLVLPLSCKQIPDIEFDDRPLLANCGRPVRLGVAGCFL
jgi:hypothetical protein